MTTPLEYQEYFNSLSEDKQQKIITRDREDADRRNNRIATSLVFEIRELVDILSSTKIAKSEEELVAFISDSALPSVAPDSFMYHSDKISDEEALQRKLERIQYRVNIVAKSKDSKRSYTDIIDFLWIKSRIETIFHPIFSLPVEDIYLPVRVRNVLKIKNITYVGELVQMTEFDFMQVPNIATKSIRDIKGCLWDYGLYLGMEVGDWVRPDSFQE